jgi:hypothetical protein
MPTAASEIEKRTADATPRRARKNVADGVNLATAGAVVEQNFESADPSVTQLTYASCDGSYDYF